MIYIYLSVHSKLIQQYKHILNKYIQDCFDDNSSFIITDHFPEYSSNKIFIGLIPSNSIQSNDNMIPISFRKKVYYITNFFVISFETDHKCFLWDVCTPLPFRRQHYFSKTMSRFLTQYSSKFNSISLYVDHRKDNYIRLIQMYAKFGFKIINWSTYYQLTLTSYPYISNTCISTICQISNLSNLSIFLSHLQKLYSMYQEFNLQIDPNFNLTIHPTEILSNTFSSTDSFSQHIYQHHNHIYIYPYHKHYFYTMKQFLFEIPSNYFNQLFSLIFKYCQKHSFIKIYTHTLNNHLKSDLTPRFFICIHLKEESILKKN